MSVLKVRGQDGQMHSILTIKGDKGDTPIKGVDYFTAEDKASIVQDVLSALPDGDEVSY